MPENIFINYVCAHSREHLLSLMYQVIYGKGKILPPCQLCNGTGYSQEQKGELYQPCWGTGFKPLVTDVSKRKAKASHS